MSETREEDAVISALMNVEGVTLDKAFRDADSVNKRKLISTIARVIAETKE
jgi:copper chaperone CopZ